MAQIKVEPFGEWGKLQRILSKLPERFDAACRQALNAEAQSLRGHMIKNLNSGGKHAGQPFAPLSPLTLVMRRFKGFAGSKPLNVTRGLAAQITVTHYGGGAFVGIRRGAPHKSGVANLALIHEDGRTIVIPKTLKMIRFLAVAFKRAGAARDGGQVGQPGVIVVRIRARPFIGPTIARWAQPDDLLDRFFSRVAVSLSGDLGRP
jgi:hypothetical protein